ncbi:hypothetical protein FIBSPDRAFT_1037356 [Athelia psychrophila]|uniref:Uncharacterized protein n=1 Tax=Athelia psychrophila TaxID=1759441 RepID=A0A166ULB6_9AGAM|nr:hypothetical protein FIBSPDRAFT_1037356 [Fibularhizoctonia sp. CBS 109695]
MAEHTKTAAELKDEGNKFYAQKQYAEAYDKYGAAIAQDPNNAILYSNRAACSLGQQKYGLAIDDAEKATSLNPSYAKAWARLATAQDASAILAHKSAIARTGGAKAKSVPTWQKALDSLPKSGLSDAEKKQKAEYAAGLLSAQQSLPVHLKNVIGKTPWECANAMRLRRELPANSSAWVILTAAEEYNEGVRKMMMVKKLRTPQGTRMEGHLGTIAEITNGIIRDERIFHISSNDWISKFNDQVALEAQQTGAWTNGRSELVIQETPQRLRDLGWNKVRPALSTTLRCWIMRAFLEGGFRGNHALAVELLGDVLVVLDWGQRIYKDVPNEDKGAIFSHTFKRAVTCLHLDHFMQAHDDGRGPNSKFPLEDLFEEADAVLHEIEAHPSPESYPGDPGFVLAFYSYPAGHALSMKGFYHARMARRCYPDGVAAEDHLRKSANFYLEAAEKFPEDDEKHAFYLNCAVENFFMSGTEARVTLGLLKRIRLAIPKMNKIWAESAMSKQGREKIFARALETEKELLAGVASGQFTLSDKPMPNWESMKSVHPHAHAQK